MLKNTRTQSVASFTLIELMVVVAIIGILSAVAVPQYSKFQAKARQSEAKVQLGGALTAERTFFAEAGSYIGCLSQIGYTPAVDYTQPGRFYAVGFSSTATSSASFVINGLGASTMNCTVAVGNTLFPATSSIGSATPPATVNASYATANGTVLTMGARGIISSVIQNDEWSMNQNGQLSNDVVGY